MDFLLVQFHFTTSLRKELNKINNRPIFTKGQRLKFTLKEAIAPHDIYEFEIMGLYLLLKYPP